MGRVKRCVGIVCKGVYIRNIKQLYLIIDRNYIYHRHRYIHTLIKTIVTNWQLTAWVAKPIATTNLFTKLNPITPKLFTVYVLHDLIHDMIIYFYHRIINTAQGICLPDWMMFSFVSHQQIWGSVDQPICQWRSLSTCRHQQLQIRL